MSFVLVSPETVAAVATDLKRIGASLAHENASAAASTTAVVSAAADEVSTAVAALFSQHAQGYQAAAAQVAAFHSRFVQALTAGAGAYAFAEAANASPLQSAMGAVSASAQTLLSRPLIGNGANATTPGGNGGDGGWLFGSGGNGAPGAAGQSGGNGGSAGLWGNGGAGGAGGPKRQQPPDNAGRLPMARWQHRLAMAVRPITPGPSHPQHNQLSSRAYARRGSTTPQAMAPLHRSDAARARRRPRAGRRRIPRRW
nr:PE family protein [Mycobacterium tuberculosis]